MGETKGVFEVIAKPITDKCLCVMTIGYVWTHEWPSKGGRQIKGGEVKVNLPKPICASIQIKLYIPELVLSLVLISAWV